MEVGGYKPVEILPTPERAREIAGAAAVVRGGTENIVGAEKQQFRNEQIERAAKRRLEGIEGVSPGVGLAARAAIETVATATSLGGTIEGWTAGLDSKLAGGMEAIARTVADIKLGEWGRGVDILTQRWEAYGLNLTAMGVTKESMRPDVRAVVPESLAGLADKAAGFFRRKEGEHSRRKGEMKSRAESIRAMKTEKAPMSASLEKTVSSLQATQTEQAAKIADLEAYIQKMKGEAVTAAQVVGGTTLENKVANGPFN